MPLTPRFDIMERNRRRRELAGLRNPAANAGPPSSNKAFSSKPSKGPKKPTSRGGTQFGKAQKQYAGGFVDDAVRFVLPDPVTLKRAYNDPTGTALGAVELASLASPIANVYRAGKFLSGNGLSVTGADMEDVEQGMEVAGLIPGIPKGAGLAGKVGFKALIEASKAGRKLGPSGFNAAAVGIKQAPTTRKATRRRGEVPSPKEIEETIDVAEGIVEDVTRTAAFTPERITKLLESGSGDVTFEQAQLLGRNPRLMQGVIPKGKQYRIGEDTTSLLAESAKNLATRGGRAATILRQEDVPVDLGDLRRVLALGRSARLDIPQNSPSDMTLTIGGVSPSTAISKANRMFKAGLGTGESIAKSIFPDFTGRFTTEDMSYSTATKLLDLLTEARGGIKPVAGTARRGGEKAEGFSQELLNANDHAIAKTRTAVQQAVEQRLARALNIDLPEDFLGVRQAELDFVNNPNENNVLVDFVANSGKGGVSLDNLTRFLQKRLLDGTLRPHARAAYQQLLESALSGKYKEINSKFKAISGDIENPLNDVVDPRMFDQVSDYVDNLRRKIYSKAFPDYTEEVFAVDMERLGNAVDMAAKAARSKGRKITYRDVKTALKQLNI